MGDPETEVVLPRLENDLVDLFIKMHQSNLNEAHISHSSKHACTVVCVSGGYPEKYNNGMAITGINQISDSTIYHAGTKNVEETLVTNGGRVFAITSLADSLQEAVDTSKKNASVINYQGKYFRTDIGYEF
jgi:phosphoribosylamine---glycine ligase